VSTTQTATSGGSAPSRARTGWRFLRGRRLTSWTELRRLLVSLLLSFLVLSLTIWVMPGVSASAHVDVLLAAAVLGVLAALLGPLVTSFALLLGWVGVLLAAVFAEAVFFYVALSLTPGITVGGFWDVFWSSWVYSLLMTVVTWLVSAGDDTAFLSHLLRQSRRSGSVTAPPATPGVVFVQVDGLPGPLLRWALQSGDLPTLTRWVRSGSHTATTWDVQLPSTTPASQAGLLHGASGQIPAFRWYEKETGRLLVANHPKDAATIQQRLTDGRGLLADGGASISNIFTGDAPTALLTMSSVTAGDGHRGPSRGYAAFFINPYGLTRSLVLAAGEMVKELYQARRQRSRDVQPRINRHGSYVLLRAVTNVLLRDLNAGLIVEAMMAGTPSIYCDFTDYDEIAHHAGPTRPESLASLAGLDHLIGVLQSAAEHAPRPYEFVILSDHGQSQGATFRQRHGQSLEELIRTLMAGHDVTVRASTNLEETAGPANTFLSQVGQERGATGHAVHRALQRRSVEGEVHLEGSRGETVATSVRADGAPASSQEGDVVVIASGNLAMVYFTAFPDRMTREQLDAAYPGLVGALVAHPGVGFLTLRTDRHGTVVLGRAGARYLEEDRVEGVDPLAAFGPSAAREVARHAALAHVGDLVLNSPLDPGTEEVAAYEELVGNHGGLGGWQTQAVLVHPTAWPVDGAPLCGADAVHRQLVSWLRLVGQRASIADPPYLPRAHGEVPASPGPVHEDSSALREA
jgi:uncharacterized membrane protein YvlD (DUF360 family)